MSEIKHNFSAGKMNKDLDERLVPNGEYRDAMNIQVRTTSAEDGSGDAGTVQNIKGNRQIIESIHYESPYLIDNNNSNETTIITSIANEKNNTAYFFAASPRLEPIVTSIEDDPELVTSRKLFIDTIVEVNTGTGVITPTCLPVAVDKWAVIDTRDNVLQTVPNTISPNETWNQFNSINSDDYRIGMTIKAIGTDGEIVENWGIDANGDGDGTVEIQNIELAGMGTSTITLYTEQLPVVWSDISFFIFEAPRVLNFDNENIITGINIIDDLLFWTDNSSEPKRINIKKCKLGTSTYTTHTQLFLENPIDSDIITSFTTSETSMAPPVNDDLEEEHITVIRRAPLVAPTIHMKATDRAGETTTVTNFFYDAATVDYDNDNEFTQIQPGDVIPGGFPNEAMVTAYEADPTNAAGAYEWVDATLFNGIDYRVNDILTFTEEIGIDSWFTVLITDINILPGGYTNLSLTVLTVNGVLPTIILDENGIPNQDGAGVWVIELDQKTPLFELKFGRFGCRYKYEDGEYSSFGPWSEVAFLPGRFDYDHKHGYNKGMTNTARELIIKDFIPHQRTRSADVVAVDLLYKTTVSPNCYVVKTITRGVDPEWDLFTTNPDTGINDAWAFGELSITSEMIHKALPANQLLRSWDNVPRQALGQEMAANRLIFSNYVQGYELENVVGLKQNLRSYSTPGIENPEKSIKSIRDYKFGMVFGDKYGRETPVIAPGLVTNNNGQLSIADGSVVLEKTVAPNKNTFVLEQDWEMLNNAGEPDSWISYVKYFIKETSNEYYNLVMDRWYNAEDGNVWISFQSADRNKLDEETYLLLKNDHGSEAPVLEKARYKILAIENEAPEFIKRRAQPMGEVEISGPGNEYSLEYMFVPETPTQSDAESSSPQKLIEGTRIAVDVEPWGGFLDGYSDVQGDLEIRVKAKVGSDTILGNTWRLVTYHHKGAEGSDDEGVGAIRWDKPFGEDADMYEKFISQGEESPLDGIRYYLEFREMVSKNQPEFDGKFFVKIEKDEILKARILKFTGEESDWSPVLSYPVAYIDNQEYNPSMMNSLENDKMARRNYRWFTNSTATDNFDENNDSANLVEVAVGVQDSITLDQWDEDSSSNIAKTARDINPGGYTLDNAGYCPGTSEIGNGCHAEDAEYMALGCATYDGTTDGSIAYWGFGANTMLSQVWAPGEYDVSEFESTGEVVYNRTRETKQFWLWYRSVSGSSNSTNLGSTSGHGAKVFIDGMRGRKTSINGSDTIDECITDSDGNVVCEEYHGMYYKPQGYENGILSGNIDGVEVGPTPPGEFGRITMSVMSRMVMESSGGVVMNVDDSGPLGWGNIGDSRWGLKQKMSTPGTKFRFAKFPDKIYQVVSENPDNILTLNHGVDNGDTSFVNSRYTNWTAPQSNNPQNGFLWDFSFDQFETGNPWYNGSEYSCDQTTDCIGIMNFTNQNPRYQMNVVNGQVQQQGYATGVNTDFMNPSNHIKVGGFNQSGNPPYSGSNAPWYEGSGGDGKRNMCKACDRWPAQNAEYATCMRQGIRFEFREFDTVTNTLFNNGKKGIDPTVWDPRGAICHDGREAMSIQIMEEGFSGGEIVIPIAHAACWETEPKEDTDLDIYYEASIAVPMILNSENTPNFVPYKSKVTLMNESNGSYSPQSLNIPNTPVVLGTEAGSHYVSYIGYTKTHSVIGVRGGQVAFPGSTGCNGNEIVGTPTVDGRQITGIPIGGFLVFEHPDGTKTMSQVVSYMKPINADGSDMEPLCGSDGILEDYVDVNGEPVINYITETLFKESETSTGFYKIDSDVWKFPIELGWFNCYTWGNGVESDRIRDDFNAPQLDNGVKVSTTFLDYGRERRGSGMIYSGLYNSTSGVNNLNEFNMAEKITKDLNPSYGSIQRIKTRDTDVVVLTEDKVLRVTTNKDALYNADGNPQLLASNRVLGTAMPFSGNFGISNNPESLSWDQFRLYFTDMQRGAVLRLSQNGITPISNVGMKTWFRDNLKRTDKLLGTWDPINGEYNITLNYVSQDDNTTVSFNEGSKGWVSFKSFIPQAAVSVGGKYITALSTGAGTTSPMQGLWEHHVDITKADSEAPNFQKVINRNVFYATNDVIQNEGDGLEPYHTNSTFSVLFNDAPSSVKAFRTVSYEGSQSRVVQFSSENATQPDGTSFNDQSDGEYYNLNDIDGWWVSSIVTDLSSRLGGNEDLHDSSIIDFKNKEGKWFNKITGATRQSMEEQDLNEFSVQGLGRASNIIGNSPQININIDSDMVNDSSNTEAGDGSDTTT